MVVVLTGVALTSPLVVPRTRSDGPSRRRGLPGRCRCDSGLERLRAPLWHLRNPVRQLGNLFGRPVLGGLNHPNCLYGTFLCQEGFGVKVETVSLFDLGTVSSSRPAGLDDAARRRGRGWPWRQGMGVVGVARPRLRRRRHGVRLPAVGATGARLSPGATRVALGGVGNCWYRSRCTAEA
jgi:hypothetical protein